MSKHSYSEDDLSLFTDQRLRAAQLNLFRSRYYTEPGQHRQPEGVPSIHYPINTVFWSDAAWGWIRKTPREGRYPKDFVKVAWHEEYTR